MDSSEQINPFKRTNFSREGEWQRAQDPADGRSKNHIPGNLLHNLPHKSRALAQMTLGARDTWFRLASFGFLWSSPRALAVGFSYGRFDFLIIMSLIMEMDREGLLRSDKRGCDTYVATVETNGDSAALFDRHYDRFVDDDVPLEGSLVLDVQGEVSWGKN